MTLKVVHVEWHDSETDHGWASLEEMKSETLNLLHTIGVLVKDGPQFVVVANSVDPATSRFNGFISIPRGMIKKMRTICRVKI